MSSKTFYALEIMFTQIERTTAATLNATQAVSNAVKQTIRDEADPYMVVGTLVDGIATILHVCVPDDSREEVANELMMLLYKQLDALAASTSFSKI